MSGHCLKLGHPMIFSRIEQLRPLESVSCSRACAGWKPPCRAACRCGQKRTAGWRHVGLVCPTRPAGRWRLWDHFSEAAGAANWVRGGNGSWLLRHPGEEQQQRQHGELELPLSESCLFSLWLALWILHPEGLIWQQGYPKIPDKESSLKLRTRSH